MVQAERTIRARLSLGIALRLRNHDPGIPVEVWLSLRVGVRAGGSHIFPRDVGGHGSILGGAGKRLCNLNRPVELLLHAKPLPLS